MSRSESRSDQLSRSEQVSRSKSRSKQVSRELSPSQDPSETNPPSPYPDRAQSPKFHLPTTTTANHKSNPQNFTFLQSPTPAMSPIPDISLSLQPPPPHAPPNLVPPAGGPKPYLPTSIPFPSLP